jgi:tetratricopeptide (TPR) repeat protein
MTDVNTPTTAANPNEGPGKGRAFFDRAKTVAATGNYDYAIQMYVSGLDREPFNVAEHQALREVALTRKVKGGKAGGGFAGLMGPKLPYKGKTPKEALLNAESVLAKDPGHIPSMVTMIRNASELGLKDVVLWIGPILMAANRTTKSPKLDIFTELAAIFAKHEEYNKSSEAIQAAIELKPTDMDLIAQAKDYAAQETLRKGKYEKGESFQGSIKDVEETKKLLQEENLSKSDEYKLKEIETSRADYEKNPKEWQVIQKYAKALWLMEDDTHDEIGIAMLEKAYGETKVYRAKVLAGDFKIRRFGRDLRILRDAVKLDPEDKETLAQFQQLNKERLAFELQEFHERAEHFPTDMLILYEYGVRLYESGKFDEAIVAFQQAQNNPKHRVDALYRLGRCFGYQNMKHESMETLERAISDYEMAETGDTKAKEMYYWLARAYEENQRVPEAIKIYSKITQWDIAFRDARKRLADLRAKTA